MNKFVLDASAILAVINCERGHEKLTPQQLTEAVASTVNIAEVHSKLVTRGWQSGDAWSDASGLVAEMIPFDSAQARLAGDLSLRTQGLGLSFGDRACLALAMVMGAQVYTAEKTWSRLKLNIPINVIR